MAGKSRRDLYAEQTRAAVIAAAAARFATDGYAATTMDAIAEDANIAKGGLYHHFASKAELFEAVFIEMETSLLRRVEEAGAEIWDEPGGSHDPLDLLCTGLDMSWRHAPSRPTAGSHCRTPPGSSARLATGPSERRSTWPGCGKGWPC